MDEKEFINHFFKEKIDLLDVDNQVKAFILNKAFKDYSFYNYLPLNLYKLSGKNIKNLKKVAYLTLYSYLYFLVILYFDKVADKQDKFIHYKEKSFSETMIFYIYEYSVRGLSSLFRQKGFWKEFNELKQLFFKSSQIIPDKNNLMEVLTCKSILANAYVLASKYLLGKEVAIPYEEITDALMHFHTGFQLQDDYNDIEEDIANSQINYYTYHVLSTYQIDNNASALFVKKLIYASGYAEIGLNQSKEELEKAKCVFEKYGFEDQAFNINGILYNVINELHYIKVLMFKTRQKAVLSHQFRPKSSIKDSLKLTKKFISAGLHNDIWEDFLTNAGLGQNWITAYVVSMLGEFAEPILPLHSIMDKLLISGGRYNEGIVKDADSCNFIIYSLSVLGRKIPEDVISSWLKFQNDDKGFSTYYNNDIKKVMRMNENSDFKGWLSSQNCVTSVACFVANFQQSNSIFKKIYYDTRNFLVIRQEIDGSWKSYWWTERLYATCFSIMALYKDKQLDSSICKKGVDYLLNIQANEGYWTNRNTPCTFYTALALKTIMLYYQQAMNPYYLTSINKGIFWLCGMQYEDGSWDASRILRLPFPDELEPDKITDWRNTSFGLNCLVDDHNRIFTSAMIYNTLKLYERLFA